VVPFVVIGWVPKMKSSKDATLILKKIDTDYFDESL
jgi:hypothetical protein